MKYFIFIIFLVITLFSCQNSDCGNGIQDGNETGIDCGGDCTPCPPTYSLSGRINQVIEMDSTNDTIFVYDFNYSFGNLNNVTCTRVGVQNPYIASIYEIENDKVVNKLDSILMFERTYYYTNGIIDSVGLRNFGSSAVAYLYYEYSGDTLFKYNAFDTFPRSISYPSSADSFIVHHYPGNDYYYYKTTNTASLPESIIGEFDYDNIPGDIYFHSEIVAGNSHGPYEYNIQYDSNGRIESKTGLWNLKTWSYVYHQ